MAAFVLIPSPDTFLVLISVRGQVDPRTIVRLEGIMSIKDSSDIGNRTVTLLQAQCGNQLHRCPPTALSYMAVIVLTFCGPTGIYSSLSQIINSKQSHGLF
jgi:hypothetical protein